MSREQLSSQAEHIIALIIVGAPSTHIAKAMECFEQQAPADFLAHVQKLREIYARHGSGAV